MAYQHRGGHGAYAAGHRGDGVHHRLCGVKLHVTAQLALLVYMDAYVHDRLACPQAVRAHSRHFAHGHHHDVGLLAHFRQIPGAGVAQGDGGVFPVQHHGSGLAHHKAAPHHHGTLAGKGDVVILQNFHAGLRGAGSIAQIGVGEHPGQRTVRNAVDVLFRAQGGADGAVIELLGQGTEQKTAVDAVVCVHLVQYPEQLLLRGIGRQHELPDGDAHLAAAGHYAPLVGEVILPLTHPHHGQRGGDALGFQLLAEQSVALVHGGHHRRAL